MITIKICEYEQQFPRGKDINEQWINQQINGRRDCGEAVFVRVKIYLDNVDLVFANPPTPGGGGGRPLSPQEKAVVDLWHKHGLDDASFKGGNLIAFLKQVDHLF